MHGAVIRDDLTRDEVALLVARPEAKEHVGHLVQFEKYRRVVAVQSHDAPERYLYDGERADRGSSSSYMTFLKRRFTFNPHPRG